MNEIRRTSSAGQKSITTTGRIEIDAQGYPWAFVQFGNITGITLKFETACYQSDTSGANAAPTAVYSTVPCWDLAGQFTAANTSVVPADYSGYWVPCTGDFFILNASLVGGSSPFHISLHESGPPFVMLAAGGANFPTRHEDDASADGDAGTVILAKRAAAPANTSGTDGDYEPLQVSNGHLWTYPDVRNTILTASGTLTADTDVIAAVTSKRIKVHAFSIWSTGTNADLIIFKSNGTGGTELWRTILQAQTGGVYGAVMAVSAPAWIFGTVAGEKLTLDVNQTDTIHYSISYSADDAT